MVYHFMGKGGVYPFFRTGSSRHAKRGCGQNDFTFCHSPLSCYYTLFLGLVDPYGIFGRILNDLFAPPVSYGWNVIVGLSERYDWLPLLMKAEVQQSAAWTAALAGIYLLVLVAFAWHHGRAYCHTICPVGTLLGCLTICPKEALHFSRSHQTAGEKLVSADSLSSGPAMTRREADAFLVNF